MDRRAGRIAMSCLGAVGAIAALVLVLSRGVPVQSGKVDETFADLGASDCLSQLHATGVVSFDTWIDRAEMLTGRDWLASAVLSETIWALGGWNGSATLTATEAYVLATDSWTPKAGMLTDRNALAAVAVNGKIYAIGGWSSSAMTVTAAVEVYDPAADTWTPVSPLPFARNALAAAAVDGKIYAIGGWDGRGVTHTVAAYNPADDTWSLRAPMPTARNGLAAVAAGSRIYAIGGRDEAAVTGKVEIYDPATDSWSTGMDMPTPRWIAGASVVNGRVYVVGGNATGDWGTSLATNEEYDPAADMWRTVTPMPTARWGTAVAAIDGRLYAIGGSGGHTTNEAYLPPAPYQEFLPTILRNADASSLHVSRPRFQVFILNPVRTCLVGNDFASGSVCRGPNCGDCDCTWEQFDPPAPMVGVSPDHVNDPQYAGYAYKDCVTITLTQQEVNDIIADMQLVRDQVFEWSGGALDLQLETTVLPHDHVGFVAPDFVFGPFEVDDELLNPYVTTQTDFVYTVSGVYDRAQGVHLAYACGGSYGEMSVHGAGYANIQYSGACNSVTIAGQSVYEPLIHEWMHNLDWGLYYINLVPDIYQHVWPDWEHWDPGSWPACSTGAANTYAWFPSVDLCEWDPDWRDCNNEASAGACLHAGEVGGSISWYEHVISAHYPRSVRYIGNHCRDGRQDFGEIGIDQGWPCP